MWLKRLKSSHRAIFAVSLSLCMVSAVPIQAGDNNKHYRVKQVAHQGALKSVLIPGEFALLESVARCDDLKKYEALNSSCRMLPGSTHIMREVENRCAGCMLYPEKGGHIQLKRLDNAEFDVVAHYDVDSAYWVYRVMGSVAIRFLLLSDRQGRLIEIPEISLRLLENDRRAPKKKNQTSLRYCFMIEYQPQASSYETMLSFSRTLISELGLSGIEALPYTCQAPFSTYGVHLYSEDPERLYTFDYLASQHKFYGILR